MKIEIKLKDVATTPATTNGPVALTADQVHERHEELATTPLLICTKDAVTCKYKAAELSTTAKCPFVFAGDSLAIKIVRTAGTIETVLLASAFPDWRDLYYVPQRGITIRRVEKLPSGPAEIVIEGDFKLPPTDPPVKKYRMVRGDEIAMLPAGTVLQEWAGEAPDVGLAPPPITLLVTNAGDTMCLIWPCHMEVALPHWFDYRKSYIIRDDLTVTVTI